MVYGSQEAFFGSLLKAVSYFDNLFTHLKEVRERPEECTSNVIFFHKIR